MKNEKTRSTTHGTITIIGRMEERQTQREDGNHTGVGASKTFFINRRGASIDLMH